MIGNLILIKRLMIQIKYLITRINLKNLNAILMKSKSGTKMKFLILKELQITQAERLKVEEA